MKMRTIFVPVLLFALIFIVLELVPTGMIAEFFVALFVFISYVGVAMAIIVFSVDNEVGREVRRQRQMHRVQAMSRQIEELERLAERLIFK
jgi:hypothetical protein